MISSLYIHIPFCRHICTYCDFCKMYYNEEMVSSYLEALQKELATLPHTSFQTIYIGGGTPSALSKKARQMLVAMLRPLRKAQNYEWTFECNPEDIDIDLLNDLKEMGINRISMGVETVQEKFFSLLGRKSQKKEVIAKINLLKKYGFTNINVDLMYALPNQTLDDLKADLTFFLSLDITHISCYSLIIEENTILKVNKITPISEDLDFMMYQTICQTLREYGFTHYEISNFAKPGYLSKHNLVYWHNEHYYGVGLGASGYIDQVRYQNTKSINHYLNGSYRLEEEHLTKQDQMMEEMILGLRTLQGVSKKHFYEKFQTTIEEQYDIMDLLEQHLLKETEEYFYIPEDKLYISNEILLRFLEE